MTFKKNLLGTMVSMAVAATFVPSTVSAQQISVQNPDSLKVVGPVAAAKKGSGVYIVKLKQAPGVTYAEKIGELIPSNQQVANKGNQYHASSKKMRSYIAQLKKRQNEVANSIGQVDVLHNYVHAFNGFSAKMSKKQAEKLRSSSAVIGVWEDEAVQVNTANTPEFLGLTGPNGQHTLGIKGDDVIVGVLDTGITPENPSFADDGTYSNPSELGWNGVCDAGVEEDEGTFECNNKLIGARYFNETFKSVYDLQTELGEIESPRDSDGHGSHTASTAAGNEDVTAVMNGTEIATITGIAPRARIAMYKVCWNSDYTTPEGAAERGCFYGDSMAAIDQAVEDGVDVLNYSIGGSLTDLTVPSTSAMLRAAQAGVFVSVSAGNDGPAAQTIGTPAPWVTTVAASTYEGTSVTNALEVTSREPKDRYAFVEGSITEPLLETGPVEGELVIAEPLRACYEEAGAPTPLDNAEEVEGKIALIQRGDCDFTEKVTRALESGAEAVVIYTVEGNPVTSLGGTFVGGIPGGMISDVAGDALYAAITGGEEVTVRLSASIFMPQQENGNMMADFSSRGPNASTTDLIKPDITAPGVRILAATSSTPMFGVEGEQVAYLSGTSMSSPHIAGLGALLIDQHPDWTPAQVRSALMTTAYQGVTKEDSTTPADPFDFGAGHAAPVSAMSPGLTYNAGYYDYMAFMCGLGESDYVLAESSFSCSDYESSGFSLDPTQLNYPSISIGELQSEETVFRTLTDVSGAGGDYTVTLEGLDTLDVSVNTYDSEGALTESDNLIVSPGGTASFGITFNKTDATVTGEWAFGAITLTNTDGTVVRSPIAIMPVADVKMDVPETLSLDLTRGRAVFPVQMLYSGRTSLDYTGLVAPFVESDTVSDPTTSFEFLGQGTTYSAFLVPEGTKVARFSLRDSLVSVPGADLDLYVYRCIASSCTQVGASLNGGSNEDVILTNPAPAADGPAGNFYIAMTHAYSIPGADSIDFDMLVWVADQAESTTRISMSSRAIEGRYNDVRIITNGLQEDTLYMGAVTFYDENGVAQGTTVLEVQP